MLRAVGRVLRLALVTAAIVAVAGTAVWLVEDQEGRDDIQRVLHDLPVVGQLVPEPDAP